jgi:hypothetical protein
VEDPETEAPSPRGVDLELEPVLGVDVLGVLGLVVVVDLGLEAFGLEALGLETFFGLEVLDLVVLGLEAAVLTSTGEDFWPTTWGAWEITGSGTGY